jgi:hypothetical protein
MIRKRVHYPYLFAPTTAILTATGDGSGVATLRIQASANTTITISDNGNFYTDAAGTEGESKSWSVESGALRTIYLKVTSGTAKLTFANRRLITYFGDASNNGYSSSTNAPRLVFGEPLDTCLPNLTYLRIEGAVTFVGKFPDSIIFFHLVSNLIYWDYAGALPPALIRYNITSSNINWTYFDVSGTGNVTFFSLVSFVAISMTSTQLIALLTSMAGRTGGLPATCTINDYSADPSLAAITAADPVVDGTAAEQIKYWINKVKTDKSVTTLSLNGTNY